MDAVAIAAAAAAALLVVDADRMTRSPSDCPDKYSDLVNKLHRNTRTTMDAKALPYSVQAQIASKGYFTGRRG